MPTPRKPSRAKSSRPARRRLFVPLLSLGLCAAVGLFFATAWFPSLMPDLQAQTEYEFPLSELRVNEPHDWVPRNLVSRALLDAGLPKRVSLLKPWRCPWTMIAL